MNIFWFDKAVLGHLKSIDSMELRIIYVDELFETKNSVAVAFTNGMLARSSGILANDVVILCYFKLNLRWAFNKNFIKLKLWKILSGTFNI